MTLDLEVWENWARPILHRHIGHTVTVNGWERVLTEESIGPQKIAWCYGGFAVNCTTCQTNLSGDYDY